MDHKLLSSWSKQQSLALIKAIERYPVMYEATYPGYPNRTGRLAAIKSIIKEISHVKPNMTPELILSKIKVLRTQYSVEKKLMNRARQLGREHTPKLWCFEHLSFLDRKNSCTNPVESVNKPDEIETEYIPENMEECFIDETSKHNDFYQEDVLEEPSDDDFIEKLPKKKHSQIHSTCISLMESISKEMQDIQANRNKIKNVDESQKTPKSFLGMMVESELSKVTEEIYDEAKWKIIHILEEASKKNRAAKQHPINIEYPSTSTPAANSLSSYGLGGATIMTVLKDEQHKKVIPLKFTSIDITPFKK